METVIECMDITRSFTSRNLVGKKQEVKALNGLSFSVPRGIVFGLLGPNGSGKTTTIRILSTLLTPTSGQARVLGFNVVKQAAKVRGRIGLILGGDRGLYARLTGTENLRYFAALNHFNRNLSRKRVKEAIELVGLREAGNQRVEQYSRGMKQRLHIARSLLTDPEIIFMDEPTIGLDPQGAQELRLMVPEVVKQGKTILLTTHYMLEADELSDHIAIINKGNIVVSGTPSEIKRKFSKINILEVILRQTSENTIDQLNRIRDIVRIIPGSDGPFPKYTLHLTPGTEIRTDVTNIFGKDNIESFVMRDPTLEEAYLSILK